MFYVIFYMFTFGFSSFGATVGSRLQLLYPLSHGGEFLTEIPDDGFPVLDFSIADGHGVPQRLDLRLAGEKPLHLSAVVTPGHGALHQCADGVPLLTAGLTETDMIKDALEQLRQGEIEIPAFLAASPQVEQPLGTVSTLISSSSGFFIASCFFCSCKTSSPSRKDTHGRRRCHSSRH